MATPAEQAATLARTTEQDLNSKLSDKHSSAEIAALLREYRAACEKTIFADFQYAADAGIEAQLWAAHSKVNTYFRKQLNKLNKENKNRAVEIRVLQKQYLEFIKSSQRFYRQFIIHLDSAFEGLPELRAVARKWKSDISHASVTKQFPPGMQKQIRNSLYNTLIQLGDLSRYREGEIGGKEKDWRQAVGYYGLATAIYPDSGISHNQQAVIALSEGNHFRATYHLYRALAAKEPHPLAKGNLELEFKKIITAWDRGELIGRQAHPKDNGANRALIAWFVRLHSKCYKGQEFAGHEELEGEVLSQLAVEVKERSLEGLVQKFILINIAAEHYATVRLEAGAQEGHTAPENVRSYFYFLRLNVKTFFRLLQILQPELERLTGEDVNATEQSEELSDKVTVVARRILPGLRLYSSWFTNNWKFLSADLDNFEGSISKVEVRELWKAYAETLTLLASAFPADRLPAEQYLLEEDVDTLGFRPLISDKTLKTWYYGADLKPKWSDEGLKRSHPNVEMVMRIRDFLIDGLELTQDEDAPLALDGMRFIYQEAGIPSQLLASPGDKSERAVPVEIVDVPRMQNNGVIPDDQTSYGVAPSETASVTISKDAAMNRMVDDLLGPEDGLDPLPEEDENVPPTPPEQTFEDTALINDSSYGITPLNAGDYVNMVRNYSQSACTPENTYVNNATASPAMRNLPTLPSLPDQSGIWSKNYESHAPSTPVIPPGFSMHHSSMGRHSISHSRHASQNSVWSPMPMHQGRSGSTPDGTADLSYHAYRNSYGPATGIGSNAYDIGMRSPLLFGGGTWGTDLDRNRSPYLNTPPNGQGGG
ncbi:uncharacterized protein K452DRAFT_277928 [Aplosporella prunicola CBS 121167]|uniref:DNA/RNA-binding domain-containing protein n=1 Tax=Aplosporella prunicola CBS 121167 TaxID=1176127 RepID=A0A6A6B4K9_9PEZI|nr:uncharacterized protein K452DRAFT_277928 [Aplosporella prunicola CBS 121167]KAF2138144.1 hypothetical protein K452DRAFT_277928 [Aplosporella prunicola CBS 121167]